MTDVFIRNHPAIFHKLKDITPILTENWENDNLLSKKDLLRKLGLPQAYIPDDLGYALIHLHENSYLCIQIDENRVEKYFPGENSLPDDYNYEQYSFEIPKL